MQNHNEKLRDMARSVLPSTRRRSSRYNKHLIKSKNRSTTRQTLHEWAGYTNPYDYEGFTYDYIYGWGEDQNIKINMWERRQGDKLSIVNWAEAKCKTDLKHLDEEARYAWFKRVLPDSMIGRHALGHIEQVIAPYRYYRQRAYFPTNLVEQEDGTWRFLTEAERQANYERNQPDFAAKLYEILTFKDTNRRFNKALKIAHTSKHTRRVFKGYGLNVEGKKVSFYEDEYFTCSFCSLTPRLPQGLHDIEAWLEMANESRNKHSYYLDTLKEFEL